jgi:Ca-activated chloride channel family protein
MNIPINSITWGAQHNWFVGIIVVLLIVLLGYRLLRVVRSRNLLAPTKHARVFLRNFSLPKAVLKVLLLSIASIGIFLAILRPMWNKKEEVVEQQGRDLFIALDISRSMLASDCEPNRLTCAKNKIKKLLPMLSSERVGLILFSGSSIIQCPLTTDYEAFLMFLDAIDIHTVSSGTTALDQAISKALEAFGPMKDKKTKLLVIFTDGEDFSSNLSRVKQEARDKGLHIFTIGVGTSQGAPIPLYDPYGKHIGHMLDDKGNVVISRLNEGILRSVAHDSGSMYISLSQDNADLQALVRSVESFEKEKLDDTTVAGLEEQYYYFLMVSFVCLLLEWIM